MHMASELCMVKWSVLCMSKWSMLCMLKCHGTRMLVVLCCILKKLKEMKNQNSSVNLYGIANTNKPASL